MQVPALIYGYYPEVERRARRMVTKVKRGASFEEAIGAHDLIESSEHDGLFNLADADGLLGGEPHYHVIYVLAAIGGGIWEGRLPEAIEETVFHVCLQNAWGILLLLPHTHSARWVDAQHRWLPFLRAAAQFWPVLEAEGKRYTYVSAFYAKMLANTVTTVDYVLGNAGIFMNRPDLMVPPDPLRPPNWPALVEAYAERRARLLH